MKNIFGNRKLIISTLLTIVLCLMIYSHEINKNVIKENVITKSAGKLIDSRSDHQAVLLNDGRVYIVGGDKTNKSAEIYDPKTQKSVRVKSMPKALWNREYTVTALNNGKVLIAGGRETFGGVLKTAWLYDPIKNNYSLAGTMNDVHDEHNSILLNNGKVLITGGNHSSIVDLYVPKFNKFIRLEEYCTTNKDKFGVLDRQGAILLKNNNVLILGGGGCDRLDDYSSQAKIFNTRTNKFYITSYLKINRGYPTLTLLKDGKVLVSGGNSLKEYYIKELEMYDPKRGIFIPAGYMDARGGYTTSHLPNGKVIFAGGITGFGTSTHDLASIYIYDPIRKSYTFFGNMRRRRAGHSAIVLKDGSILFIGGTKYKDIEIFKLNNN